MSVHLNFGNSYEYPIQSLDNNSFSNAQVAELENETSQLQFEMDLLSKEEVNAPFQEEVMPSKEVPLPNLTSEQVAPREINFFVYSLDEVYKNLTIEFAKRKKLVNLLNKV